ncbi:MAG: lysophospholipid acyltransferase family protein [Rhodospirillaceae bacterium]|nr:lysophospholipid acyltransferase family protein [Rhodospirillaceae bacterium]
MTDIHASSLISDATLPTGAVSTVMAALRAVLFLTITIVAMIAVAPLVMVGIETAPIRRFYFRVIAKVLGFRILVRGAPASARPLLLVSNHVSYLDVLAIGTVAKGEFISRADVADWPLFGWMAKAARTVFIDRRRSATSDARDQIQDRLNHGGTLIMFPESTSGDGNRVLPFKSALFTVAEKTVAGQPVTVQPVSIAYTRLNGLPIGFGWRAFYAWYGDMTLAPHLWQVLKLGQTTVEIVFHEAFRADQFEGRKALAAHCEQVAGRGFAQLLAGRGSQSLLPPPRS